MICGHERGTLRQTLRDIVNVPNMLGIAQFAFDAAHCDSLTAPHSARVLELHDPVKLAAIIAELMRERGILVGANNEIGQPDRIAWDFPTEAPSRTWTMSQARAFAFALLDASSLTTQDIERLIQSI